MSTVLRNSPALKIVIIVICIVLVVTGVATWQGDDPKKPVPQSYKHMQAQPDQPEDVGLKDTAAEDRARISAQMKSIALELKELKGDLSKTVNNYSGNPDLSDIQSMVDDRVDELTKLVEDSVSSVTKNESEDNTSMNVDETTDNALSQYFVSNQKQPSDETNDTFTPHENKEPAALDGFSVGNLTGSSSDNITWVKPVDAGDKGLIDGLMEKKNSIGMDKTREEKKKDKFVQYATIDKEAILYDAIVLTELVGVTVYSDKITSPYYFKVELGKDNLMTSGINLPHIAEMRMSGYAVGEWTTSCVQGIITSATFVFDDGTISTWGDKQSSPNGEGIAYITDPYGSPCIKGQKFSDLHEYAAVTGGLSGLSSIGQGLANAQYQTTSNGSGLARAFTGSSAELAVGEGLSGSTDAYASVLAKRYENTRDIVIAPPGQYVVIQLMQQIEINYDPEGRKILNDNFESDLADYYQRKARDSE